MPFNLSEGFTKEQLKTPISEFIYEVETAFSAQLTVEALLASLEGTKIKHDVRYFYVIDHREHLLGILSTRDILFSARDATLESILHHKPISISSDSSLETTLKKMIHHELMALPVVDEANRLIGIFELPFHLSSQAEKKEKKFSRDIFQLIGLSIEESNHHSSVKEFKLRMPWLLCNIFSGLTCAFIASFFQDLLDHIVIISMFIPLVLTMGESISMQSMTLSLPFLSYDSIPWKRVKSRVRQDSKTAFLLGIASACIIGSVYLLWDMASQIPSLLPLVAISLSIFFSMVLVATFGSLLPIFLHAIKLDPKVASGPVVLTLTDIAVTLIYFSFANFLLI